MKKQYSIKDLSIKVGKTNQTLYSLIKNNQEYQNLLLQRKSLEEKIKQVESGSGLAPLMGNKEKKKEERKKEA